MSSWGIKPEERKLQFPYDSYPVDFDAILYRGVTIHAPAEIVFRWLCQMRVAPYSYDWIDNLGRQSPRYLIPGLERLELGQKMMGFELIDFKTDQHQTLRGKSSIFGEVVGSYLIVPQSHDTCRLLVKLVIRYPRGVIGFVMSLLLSWGDMVMMRRQLLNFKALSEQTYRKLSPG